MKAKVPMIPMVPVNEDFRGILICAVRYAVGRETYMPGLVTDYITENCSGKLTDRDITVMLRDIDEQRHSHGGLGMECDVRTWERFEAWLKAESEKLCQRE